MKKGLSNKLTGQVGEHLVCSELGLRGYLATPFAGNVPEFDLVIADKNLNTLPVQVKTASHGGGFRSTASHWMDIKIDEENKCQIDNGDVEITNPDLIYVMVELRNDTEGRHRFYILTKADIQKYCCEGYRVWMDRHNWKRPRNYKSLDCTPRMSEFSAYEDNWELMEKRFSELSKRGSNESGI